MTNATQKFLALTFTFFLLANPANAQVESDTARRAAWQAFQAENGAGWTVRWNERTGTPASIVSGVTKPYSGAPAAAAQAFLREYRRLFGMEPELSDLKPAGVRRQRDVEHVRFQQTYEELSVYEADYLVHLRDGRVIMANGTYYPKIKAPTTPQLSAAAAQRVALADLKGQAKRAEITSELIIYPQEKQFHLAWQLTVPTEPFGGWAYFIDARSGAVLHKYNQLMDVTGDGRVYPKHPGISSTAIRSLPRLNSTGRLRGTYVRVVNDEGGEAYRANHSFRYSPSNPHFDEVNLYYHVDRFRKQFINDLTGSGQSLNFTQITAHAHAPLQGQPNAWFDPNTEEIYFNDEDVVLYDGIGDFAKEDKIIYHEYSHAVIYDVQSGITSNCEEEGAVSEGTPDYFAGAYTGRAVINEYVLGAGHPLVRNMTDPEIGSYSEYQLRNGDYPQRCGSTGVEAHDGGEFWSSVLWDLRSEPGLGAGQVDQLVFSALFYLDSNPTFLEFRDAMTAEESNSQDDCRIRLVFARHGLGSKCGAYVSISGPIQLIEGQSYTWTASVSPSHPSYAYHWAYRLHDGDHEGSYLGMCAGAGSSCTHTFYVPYTTFVDIRLRVVTPLREGSGMLPAWVTDPGSPPPPCDVVSAGDPAMNRKPPPPCPGVSALQALPQEFALQGSAPNPFSERTEIHFALPEAAHVRLVIYDVMGREVMRILDEELPPGYHTAPVNASDLASGIYLYRMTAGDTFADTGRMVVVK